LSGRSHKPRKDKEEIAAILVDCAFRLHRDLGPGLLVTVYEVVLAKMLRDQGLEVEQKGGSSTAANRLLLRACV
jgi:iron complex transport system substrate-binding protein